MNWSASSPVIAKLKSQIAQLRRLAVSGADRRGVGQRQRSWWRASLHRLSSRAARPVFALNCAAIAPTLVSRTLFGLRQRRLYRRCRTSPGYFETAQRRHAVTDAMGELPLDLQAKLLRVLENGE